MIVVSCESGDHSVQPMVTGSLPTYPINFDQQIKITSWNYGYASLGAEADFIADGGSRVRPSHRNTVRSNSHAVARHLALIDPDIVLLQEAAPASWATRYVDTLSTILEAFPRYSSYYSPTVEIQMIVRLRVGNALISRFSPRKVTKGDLPSSRTGPFEIRHHLLIARYSLLHDRELVIANAHFAAFDEDATVRLRQLAKVRRFARSEYDRGNYVIVGGDWNLRLTDTTFEHSTSDEFIWWLFDLPRTAEVSCWRWVVDPKTPTVRLLHEPYVPGRTYTSIIDGFLVSPNIEVISVRTSDLEFQHADHNPVTIVVALRYTGSEDYLQ